MQVLRAGCAVLTIAAATLVLPSPAQAAASRKPKEILDAVSCASANFCTAVGEYATPREDAADETTSLGQMWNGTRWRSVDVPEPANSSQTSPQSDLTDVSCASATFCMAVADYVPHDVDMNHTYSAMWNGKTWRVVPTKHRESREQFLDGVDCTSRSMCIAVGSVLRNGIWRETADRWDGTRWHIMSVPQPSQGPVEADAVSCPTPTWCTLTGQYAGAGGALRPFAAIWHDGKWTQSRIANPTIQGPKRRDRSELLDVSCVSPQRCIAVGYFGLDGPQSPLLEMWDGSHWSQKPTSAELNALELSAISCSARRHCVAAAMPLQGGDRPNSYVLSGSKWHIEPFAEQNVGFNDLNCVSARDCFAVGFRYAPGNTARTLIEHRGSNWRTVATP